MLIWAGIGLMFMLCWAVLGGGVPSLTRGIDGVT